MKPLYALHKDAEGKVIAAGSFGYSYMLRDWLNRLDVRSGDKIEFGETVEREAEAAPELTVAA